MKLLPRLLMITFIESFATTSVQRGVFLFTEYKLDRNDNTNLWLAFIFGVIYVFGSGLSHRLANKIGERNTFFLAVLSQIPLQLTLMFFRPDWAIYTVTAGLGFLSGLKWPVMESYISAGKNPQQTRKSIGMFNISWAAAVPSGAAAAGFFINIDILSNQSAGLFTIPSAMNILAIALLFTIPTRPSHLHPDHPDRPSQSELQKLAHLLNAHRTIMFACYATMFILAAMLPTIFNEQLGLKESQQASAYISVMDWCRLIVFAFLGFYAGWHGKAWPVIISIILMPIGFYTALFSGNLPMVVAGEILFGFAMGLSYFGALYYVQLIQNANVDAGGKHEGFIGMGCAIGPGLAIIASSITPAVSSNFIAQLIVILPFFLACSYFAAKHITACSRKQSAEK